MLSLIKNKTAASLIFAPLRKNQTIFGMRSASKIPPGIVGHKKRILPAHMYKPRPRWETGKKLNELQ